MEEPGWTILYPFGTRDRGDSYLVLINCCPYPWAPPPCPRPPPSPFLGRPRDPWCSLRSGRRPRAPGLTLILICPTIVHFYYSHILPGSLVLLRHVSSTVSRSRASCFRGCAPAPFQPATMNGPFRGRGSGGVSCGVVFGLAPFYLLTANIFCF